MKRIQGAETQMRWIVVVAVLVTVWGYSQVYAAGFVPVSQSRTVEASAASREYDEYDGDNDIDDDNDDENDDDNDEADDNDVINQSLTSAPCCPAPLASCATDTQQRRPRTLPQEMPPTRPQGKLCVSVTLTPRSSVPESDLE